MVTLARRRYPADLLITTVACLLAFGALLVLGLMLMNSRLGSIGALVAILVIVGVLVLTGLGPLLPSKGTSLRPIGPETPSWRDLGDVESRAQYPRTLE